MSDVQLHLPALSGAVIGSGRLARAFAESPRQIVKGAEDGLARGLLGFRKEWLGRTGIAGLGKPSNRWIWIVRTRSRGTLDSVEGRMFPRKFHRSYLRFERGGVYEPREASFHAIAFRWNRGKSGRPKKGYASPEAFQKTFGATRKLVPIKASGGRVMLIEWRRRDGRWKPQQPAFLLVPAAKRSRPIGSMPASWRSSTPTYLLTIVQPPDAEQEPDRDLLRTRQKLLLQREQLRRHMHALLRRNGLHY